MKNNDIAKQILAELKANGNEVNALGLFKLIALTNRPQPQLVVLHNYSSDKSDNTELQDCKININVNYGTAKDKSIKAYTDVTVQDMQEIAILCTPESIKGYRYIDRKGLTDEQYCLNVVNELPNALYELQNPKTKETNSIKINNVLSYFPTTGKLNIFGELVTGGKTVTIESDAKITAKGAKTVAKEVISNFCNPRTNRIRMYSVNNLHYISIGGYKLELHTIESVKV